MEKWVITQSKRKDKTYVSVAIPAGFGKGYKKSIGIGNLETLKTLNLDPINALKVACADWNTEWNKEKILSKVKEVLAQSKKEIRKQNFGIKALYELCDKINPFKLCEKSKSKNLLDIAKYIITSRIINQDSLIKMYQQKHLYDFNNDFKKSTFYNSLDYVTNNKNEILKQLNNSLTSNASRDIEVLWYDSTTVYFESFARKGLRYPGYSKGGKFKEDQIVIGMITDCNGIPFHFKIFKGNTADMNTFIPFILEIRDIYNIKNVTIVADRGMSTNRNIRFLESLNIDYILSYRLKSSTKQRKEYTINQNDYIRVNKDFKYKEIEFMSLWKNKRFNGHKRRQIMTHSKKRAAKDFNDRMQLIEIFNKKQKNGRVIETDLIAAKKHKFFKKIGATSYYQLDLEKISEDEQFDGYYVYETSRIDLKPLDIVDLYQKQWQIENNFRNLKNCLKIRPMYVWSENHIEGYITLCFISLVLLQYGLNILNKYVKKQTKIDKNYSISNYVDAIKNAEKIQILIDNKIINEYNIENTDNEKETMLYELIEQSIKNYNVIKL
ncbi:IS1634 family transposase [Mycoplasmopsis phocirhinis]|uniref:IS1634 family transposase n=1 Tax=Mycoplasmopsis phocirhinis TaxID=142650 RepID=A0A4P6MPK8_9BACT|nr:IS1634 family transposase [Mycoplasmopsis phocirhinis]QBF34676.1 IS1634 family transposase [Mycoplasmopsis phocirhinis]